MAFLDKQKLEKEQIKMQNRMKRKKQKILLISDNPLKKYQNRRYIKEHDLQQLFNPIVYIFWKYNSEGDLIAEYIGKGTNISRPLDINHHKKKFFNGCHELEIIFCSSREEAKELELRCIKFFKPRINWGLKSSEMQSISYSQNRPKILFNITKSENDDKKFILDDDNEADMLCQ